MAANPLVEHLVEGSAAVGHLGPRVSQQHLPELLAHRLDLRRLFDSQRGLLRRDLSLRRQWIGERRCRHQSGRSEEHTSELQSLMRISYAVFCLKKKNINKTERHIK